MATHADLVEKGFRLRLNVIEALGFGDFVDNTDRCAHPNAPPGRACPPRTPFPAPSSPRPPFPAPSSPHAHLAPRTPRPAPTSPRALLSSSSNGRGRGT